MGLAASEFAVAQAVPGLPPAPTLTEAVTPTAPIPPTTGGLPGASGGVFNQPVIVNPSEKVEMERLRITEELTKAQREDLAFREEIAKLQKKLASTTLTVAAPGSVPNDYRTFLSLNESQVAASNRYYAILQTVLNDLTPQSPYLVRTRQEGTNPQRAQQTLLMLDQFPEDDGISRTLRGHVAEFYGGRVDDSRRITEINDRLTELDRQKKQLEFTLRNSIGYNPLTGAPRSSDDDRTALQARIQGVADMESQLKVERQSLHYTVTETQRKLQFQQFIVQLALQQRYIHALIACGFYRGAPSRGDLAISNEAYPPDPQKSESPEEPDEDGKRGADGTARSRSRKGAPPAGGAGGAFDNLTPAAAIGTVTIPKLPTITAMESFLTSRIRDAQRDRLAFENMIKDQQVSAAEGLLRKMVMTAKYQPELNTIPYALRQQVQLYGQEMRALSDAVLAKDYEEMKRLVGKLGGMGADTNVREVEVFASEQPVKARYLARQAELAISAGDFKAAQGLTDAAINRAPLDREVKATIDKLQTSFVSASKQADELQQIVEKGDHEMAFKRAAELAPLAAVAKDPATRTKFEQLIETEKRLRTALEKCDAFERRSAFPEMWLILASLEAPLAEDPRVNRRITSVAGRCPRFVEAYTKGAQHESAGSGPIALAWYLSALPEAPASKELVDKINTLASSLIQR